MWGKNLFIYFIKLSKLRDAGFDHVLINDRQINNNGNIIKYLTRKITFSSVEVFRNYCRSLPYTVIIIYKWSSILFFSEMSQIFFSLLLFTIQDFCVLIKVNQTYVICYMYLNVYFKSFSFT